MRGRVKSVSWSPARLGGHVRRGEASPTPRCRVAGWSLAVGLRSVTASKSDALREEHVARSSAGAAGKPLTVRVATWSARHRWPVVAAWFVFTFGLFAASMALGGTKTLSAR